MQLLSLDYCMVHHHGFDTYLLTYLLTPHYLTLSPVVVPGGLAGWPNC